MKQAHSENKMKLLQFNIVDPLISGLSTVPEFQKLKTRKRKGALLHSRTASSRSLFSFSWL
jgi:hypothetical protein